MPSAARRLSPVVEARPAAAPAATRGYPRSIVRFTHEARKFGQGAMASVLTFAGADSMTRRPLLGHDLPVEFGSVESLLQAFGSGQLTGPLQILGAVLLYLAAGQSFARVAGLVFGAALLILYLQGVTVAEMVEFAAAMVMRVASFIGGLIANAL